MRSGVPAAASASARATTRRASSILKALSPGGFCVGERGLGGAAKERRIAARAEQDLLRSRARHGFSGDAAEREPRLADDCRPRCASAAAAETTAKA